jgi:uncharacterized protein YcbK (DUF882 family)
MPSRPEPREPSAAPVRVPARRRALVAGAVLLAAPMLALPRRAHAGTPAVRRLALRHMHTRESLSLAYAMGDRYDPDALARVNWLLRDFRTGDVAPIDPQLLDQLHTVSALTGSKAPFEVISGFRSPATNGALQQRGRGVATHSLHLDGRAIDVRLADVDLADLRDAALSLKRGGVGYYRESRFVHLDTGRVRRW